MRKNRKRRKGPTKPRASNATAPQAVQPAVVPQSFTDALALAAGTPDSYVLHGIPVDLKTRKRTWRAWVEYREHGQWFCAWIGADDRAVRMDLLKFYDTHHLTMDDVCRWEAEAAMALAQQSGHVGPWACDTVLRLDRRVTA